MTIGPIVPQWDRSGERQAKSTAQGQLALGTALAHGRFNQDGFDDLAVGLPGQLTDGGGSGGAVYVYFGSATGIASQPDVVLVGNGNQQLGAALAAVRSADSVHDDLVVGAPGENNGAVYRFAGGATFVAGVRGTASAILTLRPNPQSALFRTSRFGAQLGSGRFDQDQSIDLVIAAPDANQRQGVVVTVFDNGTTPSGIIEVSEQGSQALAGVSLELITARSPMRGRFAQHLRVIGATLTDKSNHEIAVSFTDDIDQRDSMYLFRGFATNPGQNQVATRQFGAKDVQFTVVDGLSTQGFGAHVAKLSDLDGDGVSEWAIAAANDLNGAGRVWVVNGATTGDSPSDRPQSVFATIVGEAAARCGSVIAAVAPAHIRSSSDVNNDGREELIVGCDRAGQAVLRTWFAGDLPRGVVAAAGAPALTPVLAGRGFGSGGNGRGQASWVGDINLDGLEDLVVAAPQSDSDRGRFEVLWDSP